MMLGAGKVKIMQNIRTNMSIIINININITKKKTFINIIINIH
jgi:hypothetical protein